MQIKEILTSVENDGLNQGYLATYIRTSSCNLNCTYCYRHKNNKNVMSLEKTFEVLEYTDKYFKVNNDEIIFSIDMTAEALLDSDKIIALDDKFAAYENLYIEENEILKGTYSDF